MAETIPVRIDANAPLFIEVDANHFGKLFSCMSDDEQAETLLAMINYMRPFPMQWDYIAIILEKSDRYSEVRDVFRNLAGGNADG